jgi:hypothetical protein
MKIAVCIPTTGFVRAKCAQALNELVAHTGAEFTFFYEEAGPLEYKRTRLALRALKSGADFHLLVDWDHTFPPDALLRLARHNLPMVGANYPERHSGGSPTAYRGQDAPARGRGVESVAAIGLGFCLIKPEVFTTTPQPWFRSQISDEGALVCGEDVHFCNQVREAGIPVHVDHDLIVGHIAETVLTLGREDANADSVLPAAGAQ